MKTTRNTKTGASILAGIAICSLASFSDLSGARAQENDGATLPQVDVTAPRPQAARPHSAARSSTAAGPGYAARPQTSGQPLVNVGPFVNIPLDAAKPIAQAVTATDCRMSVRPGHPYFVEFRARTAASYGHAFLFHGKLTPDGHFARVEVAGHHPAGDSGAVYMMGHVLPVAAETGASYGDLDEQFMTARFCVTLTEAEYARVLGYIRQQQASSPLWNAMTFNCTAWTGNIARFMGYKVPANHLQVPEDYINEMHRLNSSPAQYAAYQAEMRKLNSIPVPRAPAEMRVTIAGTGTPAIATANSVRTSSAAPRAPAPAASQAVATAPYPPTTGW
jgi:hypothetical protein